MAVLSHIDNWVLTIKLLRRERRTTATTCVVRVINKVVALVILVVVVIVAVHRGVENICDIADSRSEGLNTQTIRVVVAGFCKAAIANCGNWTNLDW